PQAVRLAGRKDVRKFARRIELELGIDVASGPAAALIGADHGRDGNSRAEEIPQTPQVSDVRRRVEARRRRRGAAAEDEARSAVDERAANEAAEAPADPRRGRPRILSQPREEAAEIAPLFPREGGGS